MQEAILKIRNEPIEKLWKVRARYKKNIRARENLMKKNHARLVAL